MKRIAIVALISAAILLTASMTFAADEMGVSIGVKGWYNSWESYDIVEEVSNDMGSAFLAGPNIKIAQGQFFAGASLLFPLSNYEKDFTYDQGYYGYSGTETWELKRSDLDIVLGYMFHPRVGIMGGYKSVTADITVTDRWESNFSTDSGMDTSTGEFSVTGVAIGATLNFPVENSGAVLLASVSYLSMTGEVTGDGVTAEDDLTGTSIEVGIAFSISPQASLNAGYKIQSLSWDSGGDEKFSGLTFGIDYRL